MCELVRVDKRIARKGYNAGKNIYVTPCKCGPQSMFTVRIGKDWQGYENGDFDKLINEFEWYNCNYELGYYPHYYIEEV